MLTKSFPRPFLGLVIAAYFLIRKVNQLKDVHQTLNNSKFGQIDLNSLLRLPTYWDNIPALAILANIPQLIVTASYFTYNRLYTSMLLSSEYDSYSMRAKALRVSDPRGYQRSTYILSLPLRWSIPLTVATLILHWLFSQSLFLARVDMIMFDDDSNKLVTRSHLTDIGFSTPAMIVSIVFGLVLLLVGVLIGLFKQYKGSMPLPGSNSVLISAACIRPENDDQGHLHKVKWGEIMDTENEGVGHCSFTSEKLLDLKEGRPYS